MGSVNAYLVDDDVLTLVDAGMPWHAGAIREGVAKAGFAVDEIERVLVTHFDLDHVGGLGKLADLDAAVFVGKRDADYVAKRRSPPLSNRKTAFQRVTDLLRRPPVGRVTPVEDGDELGSFTAIHTPGHTRGHVTYVSTDLDVAFVGDLLRSDGAGLAPNPWFLNEDVSTVTESIAKLAEAMPAVSVVAPGHGEPLVEGGYGALATVASSGP